MTTARYLVGDVFDRMAELPDNSVDLVLTSPPFLALRSYLPENHPDKAKEIGSEATPADFLDTLLALTAEWGRLLAPHGSICVELGDTYAGSGGAGGDYGPDGLRAGQPRFRQGTPRWDGRPEGQVRTTTSDPTTTRNGGGIGWPLDKSLCGIPTLYAWSLAYGRNLLRAPLSGRELLAVARHTVDLWAEDGRTITATELLDYLEDYLTAHEQRGPTLEYEQWRIRNLVAWVRPNPPVGALGDKFRPATSYLTIACRARDRYFDLDAVRTQPAPHSVKYGDAETRARHSADGYDVPTRGDGGRMTYGLNPAGAPPLDWWNHVDTLIDDEIRTRAGKRAGHGGGINDMHCHAAGETRDARAMPTAPAETYGAQGSHIRRRLEQAGYLGGPTDDVWDITPGGTKLAHYAVFPPELCVRPILAMTPTRVCTTCGQPSRRLTDREYVSETERGDHYHEPDTFKGDRSNPRERRPDGTFLPRPNYEDTARTVGRGGVIKRMGDGVKVTTVGWSDCGCPDHDWRPGHVLDPFAGSGTTLAVATGHGREATGIDIDPRNAQLAQQRCGMFLEVIDKPAEAVP